MQENRLLGGVLAMIAMVIINSNICRADENFSGAYRIPAGAGPALNLTLQQDAAGNATGVLDNGQMKFQVQGALMQEGENKGKMMVGAMRSDQATMFFAAMKQPGGGLQFVFIQPGADGKPDLQKTNTVVFPAPGGGPAPQPGNATPNQAGGNPGSYSGTYKINGTKGAITLTLQQDAAGQVTGSLNGGAAAFQLKGKVAQEGAAKGKVAGAAYDADGKFASFFQVEQQPGKVVFSIIGANKDGDPDMAQKTQMAFPAADAGPAAPAGNDPGPAPAGGPYAGTFKNADMVVTSHSQDGGYAGTINFNDQTFNFTAKLNGDRIEGTFASKDGQFAFAATLEGDTLSLTTADTTYKLTRQNPKPVNPLARPQPVNPLAKG
jgi:hypothetical protein